MELYVKYFSNFQNRVSDSIEESLSPFSSKEVVHKYLARHLKVKFHRYYFQILKNEQEFLASNNFFRQFNIMYKLRTDNDFLKKLELAQNKKVILTLMKEDKLIELFFRFFHDTDEIHKGAKIIKKELGSFFTKFVHTFKPDDYCALDNKIKTFFGLKKEGFFISMCVISSGYKQYAMNNKQFLIDIKNEFRKIDREKITEFDKLSDLKLLDMIFWTKANSNI